MSKKRTVIKKVVVESGGFKTTLTDGKIGLDPCDPYKIPDNLSDLKCYVVHLQEVIEVMEEYQGDINGLQK